jgi:hypothetical protein
MPPRETRLETADATYYHFKSDIFKREITYSTDKAIAANLVTIDADRAFEIIARNKRGEKPMQLLPDGKEQSKEQKYNDILDADALNRFDKKKRKKKKKGSADKAVKEAATDEPATDSAQPAKPQQPRQNRQPKADAKPAEQKTDDSQPSQQPRNNRRNRPKGPRQPQKPQNDNPTNNE